MLCFSHCPLGFNFFFNGIIRFEHVQSNSSRYIGYKNFEKLEQTVVSNRSADRVRKRRLTLLLLPGLQNFIFYFYNGSGPVQSKNGVDLVEVSIF